MSLFSKQESYIGVDIGAHGIKLVELKKTKGRPQLWTYGILDKELDVHLPTSVDQSVLARTHSAPVPMDQKSPALAPTSMRDFILNESRIGVYANLLKTLAKEARVSGKRVTSSLPVSYVFHAILNLPHVEEKELPRIVEAEVAKMISRPAEEMQIVYQKVPPKDDKKNYTTLLVTAAPKVLVAFYTAIFEQAGLELQELETEAFALARSLVGKDASISMVVDIGAERTNFFIIDSGLPMTHRSLHLGGNTVDELLSEQLGIDRKLVGQVKKDISSVNTRLPYERFMPLLDPLVKEIQYSFDLYLKQTGNEGKTPEKIILTGGACQFSPVAAYLTEMFPLKVFVGDPWARVIYQSGLKPVLRDVGSRMAVSIGLALRHF